LRRPATLEHLKAQIPAKVPWKVLLIDNTSEDDTAKVAMSPTTLAKGYLS
jgi:hypothetical protein